MGSSDPWTVPVSRGQASVISVILILGVTVLGVTSLLMFGSAAVEDAHSRSEVAAAEQAMLQLDSRFSLVAFGSARHQPASISTRNGATLSVDGDAGRLNVTVRNRSSGSVEYVIIDSPLGAITYEKEGTRIAYQGGGVWKTTESGGSTMSAPPEFHFQARMGTDPTLTLPIVLVRGNGTVPREAVAESVNTTTLYPLVGSARSNPLEHGEVNVTVQSEYYLAWGRFFEQRTGGAVDYDHDQELATVTFVTEDPPPAIQGGIVSGDAETTLDIQNHADADSYDSSEGNYTETSAENTSIVSAGYVKIQNHATVAGDLVSGASVELQNQAQVTGNVSYGGSLDNKGGTIGGWTSDEAHVSIPDSVGWLIADKRAAFEDSNDNSGSAAIDDATDELTGCDTTCELSTGDYILQEVDLKDEDELVLDTSSGDVDVVVRQDVILQNEAEIRVTGGGRARFFVEDDLKVQNHANVTVPDHRSPGMWFYMRPGSSATVQNHATVVGVIYGPGDGAHSGVDVTLHNHAEVYGAVVGSVDAIHNGLGLHFDEALTDEEPLGTDEQNRPRVTYLHVSVNEISVTSE